MRTIRLGPLDRSEARERGRLGSQYIDGSRVPYYSCWDRANTAGCGAWGVHCYCCCALTGAPAFYSVCSLCRQLRTDGCDLFGRDTDAQQPLFSHHHRDENSQTESNRLEEWDGLISIDSFLDLNCIDNLEQTLLEIYRKKYE